MVITTSADSKELIGVFIGAAIKKKFDEWNYLKLGNLLEVSVFNEDAEAYNREVGAMILSDPFKKPIKDARDIHQFIERTETFISGSGKACIEDLVLSKEDAEVPEKCSAFMDKFWYLEIAEITSSLVSDNKNVVSVSFFLGTSRPSDEADYEYTQILLFPSRSNRESMPANVAFNISASALLRIEKNKLIVKILFENLITEQLDGVMLPQLARAVSRNVNKSIDKSIVLFSNEFFDINSSMPVESSCNSTDVPFKRMSNRDL